MADIKEALLRDAGAKDAQIAMSDNRCALTHADLAAWVAGAAADLGRGPETVGILGENGVNWAVAYLAAGLAGKTVVPVPTFFSREQLAHLAQDASIERVIATDALAAAQYRLPVPVHVLSRRHASAGAMPEGEGGLIIYTSGSTGRPKGVRLESGQTLWSARALADASGATPADKYLSVLPLPMLLELICGVLVPVLVGGRVHYEPTIASALLSGSTCNIAGAIDRQQPTTTVFVPQLLALYTTQLAAAGSSAPGCLRFVAVGGAPLPPALAAAAAKRSIPVHEGYGLSECCSGVSVNRPGAARMGTAGQPLPGLTVTIEEGEIVVEGPSVMDGYLHGRAAPQRWRTGDLGSIDAEGYLTVHGRRDNLIVTPAGRNISPEWIEMILLGDLRIGAAVLGQIEGGKLALLLIPSRAGGRWFEDASPEELHALVAKTCAAAPHYALPQTVFACGREEAGRTKLFTPNGRIRRPAALALLTEKAGPSQSYATMR